MLSDEAVTEEVVPRVIGRVLERSEQSPEHGVTDVLYETIYSEQSRLARTEPDKRSRADREFLRWLRRELKRADEPRRRELLFSVVSRYADEIAGHFDRRIYQLATRFLPPALSAMLHGFSLGDPKVFDVEDSIEIEGEIDALRSLSTAGTVMLAPTHASNLDSVVLGSVIYRLGLPPFAYAAGLNLFTNPVVGFFMRNLGAYTVDRKKIDPLYRDTLKEYATVLLERGQHVLLFPGGTRSRSGAVERRLKKGILGAAPRAFRRALETGVRRPRIYVVPCTVTYPLVLEGATLIEDYLRAEGGPHYIDMHDEFERPRRWFDFLRSLRQLNERVIVRISRPLDWLGNDVDARGTSHDRRGREVDPSGYLLVDGRLAPDEARDAEYTRSLESRILEAYRHDNVALPTSVLAFAFFEGMRRGCERLDLFRLLRGPCVDAEIPEDAVSHTVGRVLEDLGALERRGVIRIADELRGEGPRAIVDHALATFASYHATPVIERRGDRLHAGDPNLVFYYRNRLEGYSLLGAPDFVASAAPRGHARGV